MILNGIVSYIGTVIIILMINCDVVFSKRSFISLNLTLLKIFRTSPGKDIKGHLENVHFLRENRGAETTQLAHLFFIEA